VQQHWRQHGAKSPRNIRRAYFAGMVALARIIKWEVGTSSAFEHEQARGAGRGPRDANCSSNFLREVNKLQEQLALQPMGMMILVAGDPSRSSGAFAVRSAECSFLRATPFRRPLARRKGDIQGDTKGSYSAW
jgi:hypothetical protein